MADLVRSGDEVAVVGGGPAGSYLAYCLGRNGIAATIYDDSHPREKPCGGGITPFALERFPLLKGLPTSYRFVERMLFISPGGREFMASGQRIMNVSREHLDAYLLAKAVGSGARLVEERVLAVERKADYWVVSTRKGECHARVLVGADGVNSVVRRTLVGPIPKENIGVCVGYFARGVERDYSVMAFLKGLGGYAWIFPRETFSSIGVGMDAKRTSSLSGYLDGFVEKYCPNVEKLSRFGASIPAVTDPRFYDIPCAGKDWILIGDAAGHVDPLLGEGIRYALWSADLAAQAIADGNPASFDVKWRKAYYRDLAKACNLARLSYSRAVLELFVILGSRSRTFERIAIGVVASEHPYVGFKRRLAANLPRIALEAAAG